MWPEDPKGPEKFRFRCLRCNAEEEQTEDRWPTSCWQCGNRSFGMVVNTGFGVPRDHMGRAFNVPFKSVNADGQPVVDPTGTELLPEEVLKFRTLPPLKSSYPLGSGQGPHGQARPFFMPDSRGARDLAPIRYDVIDAVEAGIETAEWWANGGEWESDA